MYLEFFGLNEKPFAITPDPRYLYLSARHADALAHLLYGISESGGFIQLTGEVGTGKTTLVRSLLEQVPDNAEVALILNPQVSPREFLQGICDELEVAGTEHADGTKALIDRLNAHLLETYATGRRTVLIVDEAQNLAPEVLEQVRLLTNLETARQKLLQIILIGQPELRDVLASTGLRQLAQRITGRYHLEPLSRRDTARYLSHRLRVAGAAGALFQPGALREIYRHTGGVPRLINVLADRALLAAYSREQPQVTAALVRQASREVLGSHRGRWRLWWAAAALIILASTGASAWHWQLWQGLPPADAPPAEPADASGARETSGTSRASDSVDSVPPLSLLEPPASQQTINELLSLPVDTGTDAAFETLFGLWERPLARGGEGACEQAEALGLACLFQRGTLSHLQTLDRPAIITLVDAEGERHQLVLGEIRGEEAKLSAPGQDLWVSAAELSRYWFGDYLVLWRPQTGDDRTLAQGLRDEAVGWLRSALDQTLGPAQAAAEDALLYDAALEARVREYQRSRRLDVDGLAGPRTRILLQNELGAEGAPRLDGGVPEQ